MVACSWLCNWISIRMCNCLSKEHKCSSHDWLKEEYGCVLSEACSLSEVISVCLKRGENPKAERQVGGFMGH
jgi:hypothetical protein